MSSERSAVELVALILFVGLGGLILWTPVATLVFLSGTHLLHAFPEPLYQWWIYLPYWRAPLVGRWLLIGAGAATVVIAIPAVAWAARPAGRDQQPLHGRSKFAGWREGRKSGLIYSGKPRSDCLILGKSTRLAGLITRYVCLPGVEHVMLFAKTGAGKGVSFVVPNCLNYADSLVVLDIKLENYRYTAAHRARMGQQVRLFSPLAPDGRTHCWNPFGDVSAASPDYISKLQRKSFDFFPESQGREKFWQDGARSAFLGIAVLVAETPEMALNPGTVFEFFTRGELARDLSKLIQARRDAGHPYSQVCVNLIADFLKGTDEVVQGVRKHVTATMGLWFNPKIVAATARSDFSLRDLRRKKMTIYVGVMPSDIAQLGVLLRLFFNQLFEANTDATAATDCTIRHRCHVLLDEFTSLPRMSAFAKAAGFARGFGLHFSYVVQSKNQVKEAYKGDGEASLLENVGAEIVFGTNDQNLCKEASERAGYDTVDAVSETAPRFFAFFRPKHQTQNTHAHRRPLLLPQDIARLKDDQAIMFRASAQPFLLRRFKWFTDPSFRGLAAMPAPPPIVTYSVARDDGTVRITLPDAAAKKPARRPATTGTP